MQKSVPTEQGVLNSSSKLLVKEKKKHNHIQNKTKKSIIAKTDLHTINNNVLYVWRKNCQVFCAVKRTLHKRYLVVQNSFGGLFISPSEQS